ncbi:FAD-dependent monooxygenase [Nocardia sp. NPDC127526]|uniref:FAD-dependent monooxygenase n=1 Tax=Nocardia sp. NPDC127526 TaxID=3345393 RepID=UPI003636BAF0
MTDTAIIIGAGIGGLATAKALRRNGWHVEIHERSTDFGGLGSGLSIAPNAMHALRHLALDSAVSDIARRLDGLEALLPTGKPAMRLDSATLTTKYGDAVYAVHRGDLHRLLLESLDDIPLHRGHRVLGVAPDSSTAAVVTIAGPDGTHALTADLVVAADGVHSRVRAALFPGHPGARYAGYAAWRGIVPAAAAAHLDVRPVLAETWGAGIRIGVMPLRDGRVYWYAFDTAPETDQPAPEVGALAARCAAWPRPIPQLLAATPADAVLVRPVHYLDRALPSFVRGPIALLGDAAHAVTPDVGQGACLALEDAVVLAATVTEQGVSAGLRAYDSARRPRTQRIAQTSGRMGRALQGNHPASARLRDLTARLTPTALNTRFADSLYAWTPPSSPAEITHPTR